MTDSTSEWIAVSLKLSAEVESLRNQVVCLIIALMVCLVIISWQLCRKD